MQLFVNFIFSSFIRSVFFCNFNTKMFVKNDNFLCLNRFEFVFYLEFFLYFFKLKNPFQRKLLIFYIHTYTHDFLLLPFRNKKIKYKSRVESQTKKALYCDSLFWGIFFVPDFNFFSLSLFTDVAAAQKSAHTCTASRLFIVNKISLFSCIKNIKNKINNKLTKLKEIVSRLKEQAARNCHNSK